MLQRNRWQIRQGVKYFMRDVTFGANSLAKFSYNMFNRPFPHSSQALVRKHENEAWVDNTNQLNFNLTFQLN